MSKRTDTMLCLFLIAVSLIVIGRDSWFSWFLIFLMVPYIIKVIIEDVFSLKDKYHFGTYLFLTILLFFTHVLLSAILKNPLHATFLAMVIFFSVAYLVLIKPNMNKLRDNFNTVRTSFHKKLILPIVFGIIGCLAGAVITETFIFSVPNKIATINMIWLYSIMPGVVGGAGVGFGAEVGKFNTKENAIKFLGMIMGLISVTLSYCFLLKLSDPIYVFLVLFLGGLCGGYVGVSSWDLEHEVEKPAGTIKYPHILEGIRSINSKSNEAARMAGRGSIISGVIYLLPAYFWAKNPFIFLFIVFSGIIIGNSIGFTAWLIKNNVKGAVSAVENGCAIGGFIGYIVPHFLGDPSAWITGILGLIIGHRVGFALWYAKSGPYERVTKVKLAKELSSYEQRGLRKETEKEYLKAIKLNPEYYKAYCNYIKDDIQKLYEPLQKSYLKDKAKRPTAKTPKAEQTMYETEIYSNDKYSFSIEYPKVWALDILEPKPEFTVELSVWFGIRGKVACSIMVGPIGPTIYGRTPKELENRARLHRQNLNATLLSSKRLTIDGIDAYEHVYAAEYPKRYVKQVGFFKGDDEYLLLFKAFSKGDFEKYEPIFDECIQSFKFKRED